MSRSNQPRFQFTEHLGDPLANLVTFVLERRLISLPRIVAVSLCREPVERSDHDHGVISTEGLAVHARYGLEDRTALLQQLASAHERRSFDARMFSIQSVVEVDGDPDT